MVRGGASYASAASKLIELDGTAALAAKRAAIDDEVEAGIRVLRQEIGRTPAVREGLASVISCVSLWLPVLRPLADAPLPSSPNVDFEVRWTMLQVAEMLVKPTRDSLENYFREAARPSLVLRLPSTPAIETASVLPTPKLRLNFNTNLSQPSTPQAAAPEPTKATAVPPPVVPVAPVAPAGPAAPAIPSLKLTLSRPPSATALTGGQPPTPDTAAASANGAPPVATAAAPVVDPLLVPEQKKKKKKEKKIDKAQRTGLSSHDHIACKLMLAKLVRRCFV